MIPTFVIFLREGVEASMIVAILLSYLDQIGQRRHFRDVFIGVAAAMGLVLVGGVAAYLLIHRYAGSTAQSVFEIVTYQLAATVLTYMTFWMQAHSRTMSAELRARWPALPVLLVSGYAPDLSALTHPFLAKPYTRDSLARRVREVLDTRR